MSSGEARQLARGWLESKPANRLGVAAGEPVRCTVKAERVGFRGYGMMLNPEALSEVAPFRWTVR